MTVDRKCAPEIARVVCEHLEAMGVPPDDMSEGAMRLVEDLAKALGEDIAFGQLLAAEVDDYLCPSCDADFEKLCDSDD